jgi:hypothetical protein
MFHRMAARAVFFVALVASACLPAAAVNRVISNPVPLPSPAHDGRAGVNRVNFAQNQNPSEAQFLNMQRDMRLGLGAYWMATLGATPQFASLAANPSGNGLFVQIGPSITNTVGQVYITAPDDTSLFGVGTYALSADPTLIVEQGTITSPAVSVGPMAASTTAGQSVPYLVECTVSDIDQTPISYNFINSQNQVSTASIYQGRNDNVGCAYKAGTSSAQPVTPVADAGYVGVAAVNVPYGATVITSQMISLQTQNQVAQPLSSFGGATVSSAGCFVTGATSLCPSGLNAPSATLTAVNALTIGTSSGNGTVNVPGLGALYLNYFSGSGGFEFCNGSQVCPASISAQGTASLYSANVTNTLNANAVTANSGINVGSTTTIAPNGMTVGGNIVSTSGVFATSSAGGLAFCATSCMATLSTAGNLGINGNINLNGGGSINMGNGTLTSGTINNSGTVNANQVVVGGTTVSLSGIVSGGNIEANTSGVFTAGPGLALSLCANNNCNTSRFEVDSSGNAIASGNITTGSGTITASTGQICAASTCIASGGLNANGNINTTSGGITSNTLTGAASNVPLVFFPGAGSAAKMNLQPSGNLGVSGSVTATAFTQSSARSLKRDIHPLAQDPLSVVASVKPMWWNYKTEPKSALPHLGLIADDTSDVISGSKHDHYDIGALAVTDAGAINELRARLDKKEGFAKASGDESLQSQIDALKNQLKALYILVVVSLLGLLALALFVVIRDRKLPRN